MASAYRIGIDLGGTKIEIAGLGPDGRMMLRRRRPSPQADYQQTIEVLADLVADVESELGPAASVGIGIPGALSPATGKVKNANSTWLNGRPLTQDLEARLRRPVRIANDANCFALSEAADGAAAGASPVFGVILGTGAGGGIVIDGKALTGADAIAGEWGHNPLPAPEAEELAGERCWCGRMGCLETWISGPALARDHERATGRNWAPGEIDRAAAAGDAAAEAALARYEHRLARGLAGVINILDPEVIVLGGGLSNLARLYRNLPRLLPQFVFSDRLAARVVPPGHGDSSGVRGAAWLWP